MPHDIYRKDKWESWRMEKRIEESLWKKSVEIASRSVLETDIETDVAVIGGGLPAELKENSELPFPVEAVLQFTGQASFHPLKFLKQMAEKVCIFEQTKVMRAGLHDVGQNCIYRAIWKINRRLVCGNRISKMGNDFWMGRRRPPLQHVSCMKNRELCCRRQFTSGFPNHRENLRSVFRMK